MRGPVVSLAFPAAVYNRLEEASGASTEVCLLCLRLAARCAAKERSGDGNGGNHEEEAVVEEYLGVGTDGCKGISFKSKDEGIRAHNSLAPLRHASFLVHHTTHTWAVC